MTPMTATWSPSDRTLNICDAINRITEPLGVTLTPDIPYAAPGAPMIHVVTARAVAVNTGDNVPTYDSTGHA